jgi:hypothetical protein
VRQSKNAIALLVTVMFVIVITVAIGFGLKQVNIATQVIKKENFMYQSTLIVEDVLKILKTSPDINNLSESNSSSSFSEFLSQAAFIPFEVSGLEIILKVSSARSKFHPSHFDTNDTNVNEDRKEKMIQYLNNYGINSQYIEILSDNFRGTQESRIFDEKPYLFRDYIASSAHLKEINDFYAKEYNDDSLSKINFDNLFYFTNDKNSSSYKIDLNYATIEAWEMMLGVTKDRAEEISLNGGSYDSPEAVKEILTVDEQENLNLFKKSILELILFVEVEITQNGSSSKISFEYDIKTKKGSNFVYEI